jgi:hypothetical protein
MKTKAIIVVILVAITTCLFAGPPPRSMVNQNDMPKGQLLKAAPATQNLSREQNLISSTPIYTETFEPVPQTWTIGAGWNIGENTIQGAESGPNSAFTNNPYAIEANYQMTSPVIALPATSDPGVQYLFNLWAWWELESNYDYAIIEVVAGATTQTTISTQTGASGWHQLSYDLTAFAGQNIQLRFRLTSDSTNSYSGWGFDNLQILQNVYEVVPELNLLSLNTQNFPFVYSTLSVAMEGMDMSNLDATNFQLYENDVLQTNYFEVIPPSTGAGARLVDIAFLMDNSGSMGSSINAISANVTNFINNLSNSGVDSALGLCRYGSGTNYGNPFLEDQGILTTNLAYFRDSVWPRNDLSGGSEPGYYAMTHSLANFNWRPGSQKVMIIITDETPDQGGSTLAEAIDACTANGAILFALTYSSLYGEFTPITQVTGGSVFDIASNFDAILTTISEIIVSNYIISYRSSNPNYDGVLRNIRYEMSYEGIQATAYGSYFPGQTPQITRTPATVAMDAVAQLDNQEIVIQATITDSYEPFTTGATLYYKTLAQRNFSSVAMSNLGNNLWQGIIPAAAVQTPGVGYYLSATDGQSTSTLPSVEPTNNPFSIAVLPNVAPVIVHTPAPQVIFSTPLTVTATVTDVTQYVTSVKLFFRRYGQLSYTAMPMQMVATDQYSATIPADVVANYGVEYFIRATDNYGMSSGSGFSDNPHFVPALINGTIIPGGEITDYTWVSDDSPFYISDTVIVTPGNTLNIETGSVLVFDPDTRLEVLGGILANGVTFQAADPQLGWLGLYFNSTSDQIHLTNCQIEHAHRGLGFQDTNGSFDNVVIQKDNMFPGEVAVQALGNSSPHFSNLQIRNYSRGLGFDNSDLRITSSPTLTNVRVRNTSSSIRDENTGLEVTGAVGLSIDDAVIEEFDQGIFWDGQGTSNYRTTPTLTNVRVRNTNSSIRNAGYGIRLVNLSGVIAENDSIGGYPNGLHIENNLPDNRTTTSATLTNVRIRNSSSSIRTDTFGAKMIGSIAATVNNMEITDYTTGMHIDSDTTSTRTSASATLTNVRIRNTNSSIRTATYGMKLINLSNLVVLADTIEGYSNGFDLVSNSQTRTSTRATLTNVRIRNTNSSIRTETIGARLQGSILATVNGVDVEDYSTGFYYEGDGLPFDRTTPTLTNVRIRNTSSSIRELSQGIVLKNLAGASLSKNIIYPVTDGMRSNTAGYAIIVDGVPNASITQNSIWGFATGLNLANSTNAVFDKNVIWTNGAELTDPIMLANSSVTVTNSDISVTGGVYPGQGNIDKNPLFADPANGNYYLKPRSPLKDTGIGALPYSFEALARVHTTNLHQGWNLLGVPYLTRNTENTPTFIFADDLNPFYVAPNYTSIVQMNGNAMPDSLGHIVFNYTGSYNTPSVIRAGVGYWVRNPYNYNTPIDVYGLLDDGSYNLALPSAGGSNNGWYLLANPYDRPLKWTDGSMVASGQIAPWAYVYNYVGNTYQLATLANAIEIPPWSGFFVKANTANDMLYLNYPAASRQMPENNTVDAGLSASVSDNPAWEIALKAVSSQASDTVTMGVARSASNSYDPMDVPELPNAPFVMNTGMDLSVLNNNWTDNPGTYSRDIQSSERGSWSWDICLNVQQLLVDGRLNESLVIGKDALSKLPSGYRFSLSNLQTGQSIDLCTETMLLELNIDANNAPEGSTPWLIPLKLEVYNPNAVIAAEREIISTSNYPNPFNPETTISYSLGKDSPVSLDIYNLKGQLVTRLFSGNQTQGTHNVTWNGKDAGNRSVASGFYFYRLTAGTSIVTRKILMMK